MEVHAHTHIPDSHRGNKWTHYLWEFLMLFLAVFCGFLAENIREHMIEKNRETKYIGSMIEDLKVDTTNINIHTKFRSDRRRRMDSLSFLLSQPDYLNHTALIYYYARWIPRITYFYSTDRTIQQLKNAGGMRLITRQAAAEAIMAYDAQLKLVQTQNYSLEQEVVSRFLNMMTPVFSGTVMDQMYGDSLFSIPNGNPALLINEKRMIEELVSQLHFVKSVNNRNSYFENMLKQRAVNTIKILKKEYHLD